jgi:hypothetical protein
MDKTSFAVVAVGDLAPHSWVRLECGDVGIIHDKVDQPDYRKVCVEIPGHRYPMRFLGFGEKVEHIVDKMPTVCGSTRNPGMRLDM